ncbi:TIGR04255 family protein [Paracoccus indicus]|uniref:TIGR04255 family protein n=1 Tax=Paracoccus indicus TaxID=2079229 RepID=UPI000D3C9B05|nr:TIGR04255 family protein [Paracoccus indicus]
MSFSPVAGHHAIIEVVFELAFSRPWSGEELQKIEAAHPEWEDDLPRSSKTQTHKLTMDNGGTPVWTPGNGVAFESFQRNGQVAWRMMFENNIAVVNCLVYDGWRNVCPTSIRLLRSALNSANIGGDQHINSISLQYINAFAWEGPIEEYQISDLLRDNCRELPAAIFDRSSHLWHQYSGWFEQGDNGIAGRTLKKVHFDGLEDLNGAAHVRCDATLRRDCATPVNAKFAIKNELAQIEETFSDLHLELKALMRTLLSDGMVGKVSLGE